MKTDWLTGRHYSPLEQIPMRHRSHPFKNGLTSQIQPKRSLHRTVSKILSMLTLWQHTAFNDKSITLGFSSEEILLAWTFSPWLFFFSNLIHLQASASSSTTKSLSLSSQLIAVRRARFNQTCIPRSCVRVFAGLSIQSFRGC
jgi:hypothetical protein